MEFLSEIPAGGTIFNAAAIVAGGSAGLLAGRFIPEKAYKLVFQCLGLFCFYLGVTMAGKTQSMLVVMFALLTGAVTGVLLDIDGMFTRFGDSLKRRFGGGKKSGNFTRGFVTTSILYCVGSMSVIGAIENGVNGSLSTLLVKGSLDGASSVLFAASMGVGALFSALPVLIYQGALTFAAQWLNAFITPPMMDNLSGLGGLVIMGISLNMLEIADVKTSNLLPGIAFALLFSLVCK
ncbi:MAG: DUF554 domain-containing protein [Synergistaceae bacterium]|nr:DUF554 domain-containing protein [Synergistaceae bacterium]